MPKEIESIYPLSPVQEGMLFHSLYSPDSGVYGCQFCCSIEGRVNELFFKQAWLEVMNRHQILRSFVWKSKDKTLQVALKEVELPWESLDWREWNEDITEEKLTFFLKEDMNNGYELNQAPLMRFFLIRLKDDSYQFIWSFHHLLLDGWSMSIVLKEVFDLYNGFKNNITPQLNQPKPYKDYITWLLKNDLTQVENYWRNKLSGIKMPTPLPYDNLSNLTDSREEYDELDYTIPKELTSRLLGFASRQKITLNTLLQGAWALLLSKYSGNEDIIYGSVLSGRSNELQYVESMVGLFINTLPVRLKIEPNISFTQWLKEVVQEELIYLQQVEASPLIDVHGWSEIPRNQPLFESVLVFENYPIDETMGKPRNGIEVNNVVTNTVTNYPLSLMIVPGETIRIKTLFELARFNLTSITNIMKHFQTLLQEIVNHPEYRLTEFSIITKEERHQLLNDWNNTYENIPEDNGIHRLFEKQAAKQGDHLAVISDEITLSYQELNQRANQVAYYLQSQGIGSETRVGVCMERSADLIVCLLGVLKAGGAYVPMEPTIPLERKAYILENSNVSILLTREMVNEHIPSGNWKRVLYDPAIFQQYPETNIMSNVNQDNTAYIIYTSGSTGTPKGVIEAHRPVINLIDWVTKKYQVGTTDRVLWITSIGFDLSVYDIFGLLAVGGSIRIASQEDIGNPERLIHLLDKEKITFWDSAPAALQQLAPLLKIKENPLENTKLRLIFLSGDWIPLDLPKVMKQYVPKVEVIGLGGATEATIWSNYYEINDIPEEWTSIPYGKPIQNARYYVLDQNKNLCPVGIPGELYIAGECLAEGYVSQTLTKERFLPDPFAGEGNEKMYHTGDLARYWEDGNIEFLGRIDHQVKIRGYRIELGEIEMVLNRHSYVQESVLVARKGKMDEENLIAYVVPNMYQKNGNKDILPNDLEIDHEQVQEWENVFNEIYSQTGLVTNESLRFVGWKSSYTGLPILQREMEDWATSTIERIFSYNVDNVLEIGCGTGIILSEIAPHAKKYYATDISKQVINSLEKKIEKEKMTHINLYCREAIDFLGFEKDSFDMVIINSVAQYFPNVEYLLEVLKGAAKVIKKGGTIFLGDIRSLEHLDIFNVSIESYNASDTVSIGKIKQQVINRAKQEKELLLDSKLFARLHEYIPKVSNVDVLLKRGKYHNELSKYRFDAVIHIEKEVEKVEKKEEYHWQRDGLEINKIKELLSTEKEIFAIKSIPNNRIINDAQLREAILQTEDQISFGEVKNYQKEFILGVDPEVIWEIGKQYDYNTKISWSSENDIACFDVLFSKEMFSTTTLSNAIDGINESLEDKNLRDFANDPLLEKYSQYLRPKLYSLLKRKLAEYMLPAAIEFLDSLPITSNGKLDRNNLPLTGLKRMEETDDMIIAPRNVTELKLVQIWREILGFLNVSVKDNFFNLGGHSLLAVRLIARIKEEFNQELPMEVLFKDATIEDLASYIENDSQTNKSSSIIVPIRRTGVKSPMFFVHPTGGNVICYANLVSYLDSERPIYALQSSGLFGDWVHGNSIEDMASCYIQEMRKVQTEGPYLIGGWSFGGTLAFEIGRQLQEKVELLAILDSPSPHYTSDLNDIDDLEFLISFINELEHFTGEKINISESVIKEISSLEGKIEYVIQRVRSTNIGTNIDVKQIKNLISVYKFNLNALKKYQTNYKLNGQIVLFESNEIESTGYQEIMEENKGWNSFSVNKVKSYEVPGNHVTMMTEPNVKFLGELLEKCIQDKSITMDKVSN